MRKLATIFLFTISFSLVLAGAVSAAAEVDVQVVDENGAPVIEASPGDEVEVQVTAFPDQSTIWVPRVDMTIVPEDGLEFAADDAIMIFNGVIYTNDDPGNEFFFADNGGWIWKLTNFDMYPGDLAQLYVPAIVTAIGEITVNTYFYGQYPTSEEQALLDSDSYTFLSVEPSDNTAITNAANVPMQNTGAPITAAILGLLAIIGGTVYSRLR
jgi:hypothetical protein